MNDDIENKHLVPNRECGSCTVCCRYPSIDNPDIVKLSNVACKNLLEGGGCAIYKDRPDICDKWFCAWRSMPHLGEEWRPDKIGVLIEFSRENFPEPYFGKAGYQFTILDKQKLLSNKPLAIFIGAQISIGVPCTLSYGIEPGVIPATAFLNFALQEAVNKRNGQGIIQGLLKAIEASEEIPKEYLKIEDGHLISVSP